jgi:hypothetical protein
MRDSIGTKKNSDLIGDNITTAEIGQLYRTCRNKSECTAHWEFRLRATFPARDIGPLAGQIRREISGFLAEPMPA